MDSSFGLSASKKPSKTPRRSKCLPRRAQDLSKEELLLTLKKKRECNAKALTIVEGMLEPIVTKDWFLDVLHHINQSHLQDVIEERAIINLCGYPLCSNKLKSIPSQQYRISTKVNKIYDITERKNFCSNKCFKAFKFIRDQMHTSPLWLRDIEPSVKFILMPSTECGGDIGDEVNVQIERVSKDELKKLSGEENSSSSHEAEGNLSLSDALTNLHIVATMRENTPLHFSEGLKRTECEEKNNLHIIETSGENSPVPNVKDYIEKDTCTSSVERKISEKCGGMSSDCDSPVPPLISLKGDNTDQVHSLQTERENFFEKVIVKEDGNEVKIPGPVSNAQDTADLACGTSSVPVSTSIPSSCAQENTTDVQKSSSRYVTSKTFNDKKTIERVECLNEKPSMKHDSSLSGSNSEWAINQSDCSSSKICHQLPQSSKKNRDTKLDNPADHIVSKKTKLDSGSFKLLPTVFYVEKCVREWFTMETMCFLFGETTLKEMLENKGESIQKHYKALSTTTWDQEKHDRFLAICKRLNLLEMEDTNFDSQVIKSESDSVRKPLPNYEVLKREAEAMELKINAFYKGKMEIDEKKVTFAQDVKTDSSDLRSDSEVQIPLVHLHAQRALRKRIVLDGLNRVLPDFLRTFGMRPSELTSSIRGLVSTFALSATNITFKPQEWSLLGLIIIKLLTLKETNLKQCLQQEQSNTYLTLMLMSYKQEPGYLDRLLSWLTDIDMLLARPQC